MAEVRKFDVLILGAGPAGLSAAICLADSGFNIALIDKAEFPKNKTCGDGLTLDVINQLHLISPELGEAFMNFPLKFPVYETRIFSPDFRNISIPSVSKGQGKPMFICRRVDFDYFLFQYVKHFENIRIFQNTKAVDVVKNKGSICVHADDCCFEGKILICADGATSISSAFQDLKRRKKEQFTLGLRAYYKGISPLNEFNPIEIYFIKDILPGYLWIFPLGNGFANVGMGVSVSDLKKYHGSIKEKFEELIKREPLKKRFEHAVNVEPVKGHVLPMSGKKKSISGKRYLMAGDAAGLVDPFSGEGVGNAIRSGRVAAAHIKNCFCKNDFSAEFNKAYDKEIYKRVGNEFFTGRVLLRLCKSYGFINFFIWAICKNEKQTDSFHRALKKYSIHKKSKMFLLLLRITYILTIQNIITSMVRTIKHHGEENTNIKDY